MPSIQRMDQSHLSLVVDLHISCFPGFFLTDLGRGFLRQYYRGVLLSSSSVALIIEGDTGKVDGFVTGIVNPSGFYQELLRKSWHRFLFFSIPAVIRRPRIIPRLLRALKKPGTASSGDNVAGITSICVSPAAENMGYGRELLRAFEDEALKNGCDEIVLYTDAEGSEKSNRFYTQAGFKVTRSYTTPEGRRMNEYRKSIGCG